MTIRVGQRLRLIAPGVPRRRRMVVVVAEVISQIEFRSTDGQRWWLAAFERAR